MTVFSVMSRLLLLLFVLWGSLCTAAVIGGQQRHSEVIDLAQYGFAACELPCWAGITPGETTSGYIIPLLERHIPAYQDARFPEWGIVTFRLRLDDVTGNVRFTDHVNQIYIMNLEIPVTYLIEKLSLPDCVNADENALLLMWYRNGNTLVSVLQGSPENILSGQAGTSTGLLIFEAGENFCQEYAAWHGFAPLWFYQQQSTGG